ncbi:hypothetical protein NQ314_018303 [Rhamnusium bicolor]|uniref:Uncharacterized protein n=1 Tax=Rhamnusium bicolor TaxID=1586634 RepID=A0AAV8WQL7_9CUCU|nr:hypothetical protein NQ314_018303 [Rhamnusium bicolor]
MFTTNKQAKIAAASCALLIGAALLLQQNQRDRRWWVKPWLKLKRGNIDLPNEFINGGDLELSEFFEDG